MRRNSGRNEDDAVEELLRAAEDETLLKINTGTHTVTSSNALDQDLLLRFNALKNPSATPSSRISKASIPPKKEEEEKIRSTKQGKVYGESKGIVEDDLLARFSALKTSSSSSSSYPSSSSSTTKLQENYPVDEDDDVDEDGVSKKEVKKLMQWAMDAARLNPSRSDDDEDEDEDDYNGNQKKNDNNGNKKDSKQGKGKK